jgi:hypothetical protein
VFLNTENISAFVGFSWKIEIEMHGATMKTMKIKPDNNSENIFSGSSEVN